MPGRRLPGKLRERDGQRMIAVEVNISVGAQHQDAGLSEFPGNKPQQQDRGRIGGMQIIQDEHQRLPGPARFAFILSPITYRAGNAAWRGCPAALNCCRE